MTKTQLSSSKASPEKAVDQRSGLRIDTPEGPVFVRWTTRGRGRRRAVVMVGRSHLSEASRRVVTQQIKQRSSGAEVSFRYRTSPIGESRTTGSRATDDRLDELHADLVATFSPSIEDLDPVPRSTVEQARRFALLAAELMRQGAYDYEALAEGWNTTTATARKRVLRAVNRSELFTVSFGSLTFVPGFLLDEQLETRPELAPIVETLVGGGDRGFALWAWLTTPTAWLDGAVPHELATADRERVLRAAAQRASNAA